MMHGYDYSTARREARRWLEELGIWEVRNRRLWVLSGGEKRRAVLASILAVDADVYLLDEPTTGIDVEGKYNVLKMIRKVVSSGSTILLTTHDMIEAQIVADEVVFVNRGLTIARGSPMQLLSKIPYKYKAVIEKKPGLELRVDNYLDLGDKVIVYGKTMSEILNSLSSLEVSSYDLREVDLEDVYLTLMRGEVDGGVVEGN